jgi:predicted ATPase/DNA-binding CsgD family transcriptional regulator
LPLRVDPLVWGPFVGRETELERLRMAVQDPRLRWITVTGRSGIGKTRLIRHLLDARQPTLGPARSSVGPTDGQGIIVPTSDSGGTLVERVAAALGVRAAPGRALPLAAEVLAGSEAWLYFDGLARETTPGDLAALVDLLGSCPGLTIVAESMLPIGVAAETPFRIGGLDPRSATELFVERASRTDPTLRLDARSRGEMESICALLHGVPLDIEIVAANVRAIGTAGLLAEVREAGGTAALGLRGPSRDRTVGAALGWSYSRLGPAAQALLRSVSVFRGPFTLAQARAVHPTVDEWPVVESLTELVDAWLAEPVTVGALAAGDEPRFLLAPLTRSFAATQLDGSGEGRALNERYATHHLALARELAVAADGAREDEALAALGAVLPDLLAVVDLWLLAGDLKRALRLAADLAPAALRHGHYTMVIRLLTDLLEHPDVGAADPLARGDALVWLAHAQFGCHDATDTVETALHRWREGLDLVRLHGTAEVVLRTLGIGVRSLPVTQDIDLVRGLLTEGTLLAVQSGHAAWRGRYEVWSGMLAHQLRDYATAWDLGVSGLARARRTGDRLNQVASALLLIPLLGRYPEPPGGVPTPGELLGLCEQAQDPTFVSLAMAFLAEEALEQRNHKEAARWAGSRLSGIRHPDSWIATGYSVMLAVRVATLIGDHELAARLHGSVLAQLPVLMAGCPPRYADRYQESLGRLAAALGTIRFERLTHEGSLLPRDEAVALALDMTRSVSSSPDAEPAGSRPRDGHSGAGSGRNDQGDLTAREQEVLELIVGGLTNREIAAELYITAKTVMHHSVSIYRKLGVRGRAEAVAWSFRNAS